MITKLIVEYETKIDNEDKILEQLYIEKRTHRAEGDTVALHSVVLDIATHEARRQAYLQAKVDIASLLNGI